MKTKHTLLSLFILTTVILSACGGAAPATEAMMEKLTEEVMMEKPTEAAMTHEMTEEPTQEDMATEEPKEEAMMDSPTWYSASLSDARTGQSFSIESLKGKVVLVETMAVWCSKCLQQQGQVKALHETLGPRDDFVSIGLDIDPNEEVDQLKGFVESQGFDWFYAISPIDVSREISSLYGDQFLNPPSTPIVVIDKHGVAHPMPFGIKSADDLLQFIQPFLDESM